MPKTSDAQRRAVAKYDAENTKVYSIKLNRKSETESKMIEFLDSQQMVSKTIKAAIQQYMDGEK